MDAGGTQFSADKGRIYVVYPNGLAQPVKKSVWRGSNVAVPPGTTVIVPKNLDPLFKLELVQNIVGIVGQLVSSVATVAILANNDLRRQASTRPASARPLEIRTAHV